MNMSSANAGPLFIIGKHRSGTSWLGNVLAEHPDIYAVRNPERHGIWESLYFTHIAEDFQNVDTTTQAGFAEWCQYMSETTYVYHSNIEARELSELGPAPFARLFERFMGRAASRADASIWMEKSPPHTLVATKLATIFPRAKFIVMSRNFDSWLRSSVKHAIREGRVSPSSSIPRLWLINKLVGERWLYEASAERLQGGYPARVCRVGYERMLGDREDVLRNVLDFTGLDGDPGTMTSPFAPNTSFEDREARREETVLPRYEKWWADVVNGLLDKVPVGIAWLLARMLKKVRDARGRPKMWWFWK